MHDPDRTVDSEPQARSADATPASPVTANAFVGSSKRDPRYALSARLDTQIARTTAGGRLSVPLALLGQRSFRRRFGMKVSRHSFDLLAQPFHSRVSLVRRRLLVLELLDALGISANGFLGDPEIFAFARHRRPRLLLQLEIACSRPTDLPGTGTRW
jgi:hypothetical protein